MTREEFENILEEAFIEGYKQAELDIIDESLSETDKNEIRNNIKNLDSSSKRYLIANKAATYHYEKFDDIIDKLAKKYSYRDKKVEQDPLFKKAVSAGNAYTRMKNASIKYIKKSNIPEDDNPWNKRLGY